MALKHCFDMKAKTKNQIRVVQVDNKIKSISKRVIKWAEKEIFQELGFRYKSGTINCLKCGSQFKSKTEQAWHDEITETKCPSCKSSLKIKATNNRTASDREYFTFVEKAKEFQVIRTCLINVSYKCKSKAEYKIREVQRIYIGANGKREVVAGVRTGGWSDNWGYSLELRNPSTIDRLYGSEGHMYEKWDLHDFIIKAGFNQYVYNENKKYTSYKMMFTMLNVPQLETIEKRGIKELYKYAWDNPNHILKYWPTLKICFRNNFDLSKTQSYFDMIEALEYFKKDLRNSHYVCPKNFKEAHDYWIDKAYKKRKAIRDKKTEMEKLIAIEKEIKHIEDYAERMQKFSDLTFSFGDLKIVPFLNSEEVKEAGKLMHHCIYKTVSYWQESKNLLLGSYYKGKLIETTQYDLNEKEVLHSFGPNNKESKHHKKIVKIIETGNHKIHDCLKPKRKTKSKQLKVA
jgi:hypothetical protein